MKSLSPQNLIKKLFSGRIEETPEQLYEKASTLIDEGNTVEGYTYLQAAAVQGHAEAAFQMGSVIQGGNFPGTMEDAVKYYIIASEKNHALATTNLATCYQLGQGIGVDHIKAIHLLNKAIKLGDDMAAFNLAQTYLLGVGVKQDEEKGWSMLESLATKGNTHARAYMDDLVKKGYKAPKIDSQRDTSTIKVVNDNRNIYQTDYAPECKIKDARILELYNSTKGGDVSAKEELLELGGDLMNREAMNALRKLGLIKEDISIEFRRGTIEYIANAWKTYNVEPLHVVCAWTYPDFAYREYRAEEIVYETFLEEDFIERIAKEMSNCRKNRIVPQFRIRQVKNSSCYCLDVLIPGVSLSSFYLDIKDEHFLGLYRVYDTIV